ncbi:MAG: twin-arginine translocase TatA/TatE family subunit [Bacteroidetes bacterium]|nr:twin-arginine translocase TatA/TatE family subunit [Bacteroidota bacterium]
MFGNIGGWEILIIIFLILIFFGAKKIPELAQGLGKGIKEFRKAAKDIQDDISLDEKKIEDKNK